MYGSRLSREDVREAGFLAGTLRVSKPLQHEEARLKMRSMLRAWERFATRKQLRYRLLLVLSDWSETKREPSGLHVHFLLWCSGRGLGEQFFKAWWMKNKLGYLRDIRILSRVKSRATGKTYPVNGGWLRYVMANYECSSKHHLWERVSEGLEARSWQSLGLPEETEQVDFLDLSFTR